CPCRSPRRTAPRPSTATRRTAPCWPPTRPTPPSPSPPRVTTSSTCPSPATTPTSGSPPGSTDPRASLNRCPAGSPTRPGSPRSLRGATMTPLTTTAALAALVASASVTTTAPDAPDEPVLGPEGYKTLEIGQSGAAAEATGLLVDKQPGPCDRYYLHPDEGEQNVGSGVFIDP